MLPLIQGTVWSLVLHGWRYWNRSTNFSGRTVGAKLRRWWWGVNKWKIPTERKGNPRLNDKKLAARVAEVFHLYYPTFAMLSVPERANPIPAVL